MRGQRSEVRGHRSEVTGHRSEFKGMVMVTLGGGGGDARTHIGLEAEYGWLKLKRNFFLVKAHPS